MTFDVEAFAAERDTALRTLAQRLRGPIAAALASPTVVGDLLDLLAEPFRTAYEAEGGNDWQDAFASLRGDLQSALVRTTPESDPDRMATWLATALTNRATTLAAPLLSVKQWVTMRDDDVRDLHRPLDGVRRLRGEPFRVGPSLLRYPGEPSGPPEVWIGCRCVLAILPFTSIADAFAGHNLVATSWPARVPLTRAGETPSPPIGSDSPLLDMTALAYPCASGDGARVYATQEVDALRDVFQVLRVDAGGDAAQVVEGMLWLGAVGEFPGDAVREALLADGVVPQASIAVVVDSSGPQPAGVCLVDVAPESLSEWAVARRVIHGQAANGAGVVQGTQATLVAPGVAPWVVAWGASRSVGLTQGRVEGQTLLRSLGVSVAQPVTAHGSVAGSDGTGHEVEFSGPHMLYWCANRRTPEVVGKGGRPKKCGAGKGGGRIVRSRKATAEEERTIARGDWVRVNQDDKKPGQPGYMDRRSKVRPNLNAVEGAEMADTDVLDEADEDFDVTDLTPDEPTPWYGVLAPEGVASGDGRSFDLGALSSRDLPLPLQWQPSNESGHDGAVIVGRIDHIAREGSLIWADGVFAQTEEADKVVGLIAEGHLRGVSVDVDDAEMAVTEDESVRFSRARISAATIVPIPAFHEAFIALGTRQEADDLAEAEAMLAAAFRDYTPEQRRDLAEKHEAMGDGSYPIHDEEDLRNAIQAIGRAKDPEAVKRHIIRRARALDLLDLIPEEWAGEVEAFKRGAGWVTHPEETARLHRYWTRGKGAAKIAWGTNGDFTRCTRHLRKYISPYFLFRTCAQWHHDALGYWPGELGKPGNAPNTPENRRRAARHASALEACDDCTPQGVTLVAAAPPQVLPAEWFADPRLDGPTPMTVDGDRVYGHLALWDTCHIGIEGVCVTPPRSVAAYAYFATGSVLTEDGRVAVGQVTLNTGHADLSADPFAAKAHYDHTGTAVADVVVGEDAHGIWFAGALRDLDAAQRRELEAAALSGDWRGIRGNLELVGALAVNVPGFPVPRLAASGGRQTALLAPPVTVPEVSLAASVDVGDLADAVADEMARREKVAALREFGRRERVAALREAL